MAVIFKLTSASMYFCKYFLLNNVRSVTTSIYCKFYLFNTKKLFQCGQALGFVSNLKLLTIVWLSSIHGISHSSASFISYYNVQADIVCCRLFILDAIAF
ncbi:hypothetical protein SLEP1_g55929 [Rubroshorea leprosula]|uniref:Uncharacterized protein n=1 Tax=Rubroshorea leprosula TaxID=152421 RepID=A0AAV5MJI3_9ROSI|nr:hypothetical protein SLEP1_g55929 [Rubroshorea leprosula]